MDTTQINDGRLISLLQHVPVNHATHMALLDRMQEPHRFYHNLEHVLEMWEWHNDYNRGKFSDHDSKIIASFCLYHDAVYDPRARWGDNEHLSSQLWLEDTKSCDIGMIRHEVDAIILTTKDHFRNRRESSSLRNWCIDLDLLRLGMDETRFIQRGLMLRQEYQHLTDDQWIKSSSKFRARVMAQSHIFSYPDFHEFEVQAQTNLANALVRDWHILGYLKGEP